VLPEYIAPPLNRHPTFPCNGDYQTAFRFQSAEQ
jgi:hypothetical protein